MAIRKLPYDDIIAVSGCLALGRSGSSYYVFDQSHPQHSAVAGPFQDTVRGLAEMRDRVARNDVSRPIVEYGAFPPEADDVDDGGEYYDDDDDYDYVDDNPW